MAQALFAEEAKRRGLPCECRSAGIGAFTGSPASDNAVAVMKEVGIDLSSFRSTSLKAILADEYDLYVPMTYSHAQALVGMGIGRHKIYLFESDVVDPYGGGKETYRRTREQLTAYVKTLADFVQKQGGEES